ncbi:MAG TPA: DinB family protein, partial [Atopostipes sp.]|nr:DinB family protein [Atopostipes sp.]
GVHGELAGFNLPKTNQYSNVDDLINAYEAQSKALKEEASKLTDDALLEEVEGFSGKLPRGQLLRALIDHQTHHRGQMTVLLRQASLKVPPIMGPTKERH